MTDIVERLRADTRSAVHCALSEEAADEIEFLVRDNGRLQVGLAAAENEIDLLRQKLEFAEFEWDRAMVSWQEAKDRLARVGKESAE